MANKPVKILEIKGNDWLKGLALQASAALGGLFQVALNFNPFEVMGYFQASLEPVAIDATTITTSISNMVVEGDGYVYAINNRAGTGTKCFYRIKLADNTVVDYSTVIDQNAATGALLHNGLAIYGGFGNPPSVPSESIRVVYEQSGILRSNSLITPTVGNDITILASALTANSPIDFCIDSNLNLFYTAHANFSVGKIVTVLGTTNNTASAFALGSGIEPRSLTNDGYYLVIAGDDNDSRLTTVTSKCKVYFWDRIKSAADVIWTIPDSYIIATRFVAGRVLVLGYSGIWECNLHTPPKLIYPIYDKVMLPTGVNEVSVSGNNLVWASAGVGSKVYFFGSDIGKPILYNPYQTSDSTDLHTALVAAGNQILAATNAPNLLIHNTGSTRNSATIANSTQNLNSPFSYSYAKVVLKSPLSSGQSVILSAVDSAGNGILNTILKSYSADYPHKDLIFLNDPITQVTFDDLVFYLTVSGGAAVKRLTIYGVPAGDSSQTL